MGNYYRSPRTRQEKRENGRRPKWARAKRSAANLPDSYWDIAIRRQKSWKAKRKTQYYQNSERKQRKNTFYIPAKQMYGFWKRPYLAEYVLEDYLRDNNIPYKIIEDIVVRSKWSNYYNKKVYFKHVIGYYFTWWSDKDIGIDYIV